MSVSRLFLSYHRRAKCDSALAAYLREELAAADCDVFIDLDMAVGTDWSQEIAGQIDACDCLIVLLSADTVESRMVMAEVRLAHHRRARDGRPVILPVRVNYTGALGYELGAYLDPLHHELWRGPADNARVRDRLLAAVRAAADVGKPNWPPPPERKSAVGRNVILGIGVVAAIAGAYALSQPWPEPSPETIKAGPEPTTPPAIPHQASYTARQTFTDTLKDGRPCPFCPEMVVVPSGSFTMGSPLSEQGRDDDEGPQRPVTFAEPFAIARHEVTFAQWDTCVAGDGCSGYQPVDRWGRGQQPVISVSWKDAQSFVKWLSQQTGESYRLPTEAEWEYAARAGTETPFWTGATISTAQANYDGDHTYGTGVTEGSDRGGTVAADDPGFPENPYGLFHVHGNVWEWVQDCYVGNYDGAPANGHRAVEQNDCSMRVLRGGSWGNFPWLLRSADRGRRAPDDRDDDYTGFRVARLLRPH